VLDSRNDLYWLNQTTSQQKVYVAGRVGEIQTYSNISKWRHVPTGINPADIPTRFPDIQDLAEKRAWFEGPAFLKEPESKWPPAFIPAEYKGDSELTTEFKKLMMFNRDMKSGRLDAEKYEVNKYIDGYRTLLKITSHFFSNIFKKLDFTQLFRKAFEFQIKRAQRNDSILDEIRENLEKDCVKRRLYASLAPFIDAKNIICSRSRLAQIAYLPYDTKFPIILTPNSDFTRLLVKSYHF
jgi:hypothetical protein